MRERNYFFYMPVGVVPKLDPKWHPAHSVENEKRTSSRSVGVKPYAP